MRANVTAYPTVQYCFKMATQFNRRLTGITSLSWIITKQNCCWVLGFSITRFDLRSFVLFCGRQNSSWAFLNTCACKFNNSGVLISFEPVKRTPSVPQEQKYSFVEENLFVCNRLLNKLGPLCGEMIQFKFKFWGTVLSLNGKRGHGKHLHI